LKPLLILQSKAGELLPNVVKKETDDLVQQEPSEAEKEHKKLTNFQVNNL